MSSPSSPSRGRPARLDRTRTLETALDLLNQAGLDALTMRRLADAMGVQAGALYRYFATKQELLTAMAERMLEGAAEAALTGCGGDWSERLAALARTERAALLAHRDGARVYAGTHSTGANTLGFAEALVGVLRDAGFADDAAARALYTVVNFTVGHTLEEQAALQGQGEQVALQGDGGKTGQPGQSGQPGGTEASVAPEGAETTEAPGAHKAPGAPGTPGAPRTPAHTGAPGGSESPGVLRDAVTAGAYPHLGAALPTLTSTDFTRLFEYGLDLLVEGLRARHAPPASE
ncbi:transcriptional regulator [Streptomyces sp. CB02923]|uniref:TetR/AcrR family transcriptional regulator C-terminal domain-containing protein n=1 Tax=Streptomyces sp. CB02923 TaxID=1718985 RepID=UPI00095C373E|nr:TetR/AcrR family transcriptional regulator C-terminal domain-containing protein [Streptomyces sp. CB02923]OKH99809.1 transcriptional regulator [Streptomyces sp. CB02923]